MPYSRLSDLPPAVRKLPRKAQRKWRAVWNDVYARAKADGKSDAEAERLAFASAWSAVGGAAKDGIELEMVKATEPLVETPDLPNDILITFPITKIDKEKRLIRGVATAEILDSQDEVLSYEGSKKAFEEWRGNVREMHQPKAVGKSVEIEFDDTARSIAVISHISLGAQDTWEKILDSTLEDYSVGGKRVKSTIKRVDEVPERVFAAGKERPETVRWTDGWKMNELSVVDVGALPGSSFALVKVVDGIPTATQILASEEQMEKPEEKATEQPVVVEKVVEVPAVEVPQVEVNTVTPAKGVNVLETSDPNSPAPNPFVQKQETAVLTASDGTALIPEPIAPIVATTTEKAATVMTEKEKLKLLPYAEEMLESLPQKAEWTAAYVNDLPDSSFAHIEAGGEKDESGKTKPRSLRHYPIKDADGKCDAAHTRNALSRAAAQIKGGKEPGAGIARKAMPKIRACAKRLKIGAFKEDSAKFLVFHDVLKIGYSYDEELESDKALGKDEIEAFVAEHAADALVTVFKSYPVTFGVAYARFKEWQPLMLVYRDIEILADVLASTLTDPDLAIEQKREMVGQSLDEFEEIVFADVESLDDGGTKTVTPTATKLEEPAIVPPVPEPQLPTKTETILPTPQGQPSQVPVSVEASQVFSPEALVKALEAPLAGLRQEVADLKSAVDGSVQKLDKVDQSAAKVEERLGKLEAQPVVPPNLALKIQERTSPDAEKAGSRLAIVGEDGKTVTLDELQKRYEEIKVELKKPNLDGKKREKLETEGFRVARDIKFLLGESVIR